MKENIKFIASTTAPNPKECMYWADLNMDPRGSVIKFWDGKEWIDMLQELVSYVLGKTDRLEKQISLLEFTNKEIGKEMQRMWEAILPN